MLIVNKVEAAVREIETWILEYENKYGVSDIVKRKRNAMTNPESRKW